MANISDKEIPSDFVDALMSRAFCFPAPEMPKQADLEKKEKEQSPAEIQAHCAAAMERIDIYEIAVEPKMKERAEKGKKQSAAPLRRPDKDNSK